MRLYPNIKKYREAKGWNQTELAERMGYSDKSMVSKVESGEVDLNLSRILKFAEVLEVPADALMGFEISEAFNEASADTKQAVRAVLGIRRDNL